MRTENEMATRPILYTDTIKGEQVGRDDMWAVTTAELNAIQARLSDAEASNEKLLAELTGCAYAEQKMRDSIGLLDSRVSTLQASNAAKDGVIEDQAKRLGEMDKSLEAQEIMINGGEQCLATTERLLRAQMSRAEAAKAQVESLRKERDEARAVIDEHERKEVRYLDVTRRLEEREEALRAALEAVTPEFEKYMMAIPSKGDIQVLQKCVAALSPAHPAADREDKP